MKKLVFVGRKYVVSLFCFLICALPLLVLVACGGGDSSSASGETGSAVMAVDWHSRLLELAPGGTAGALDMDCDMIGVETVMARVYSDEGEQLAEGGPWSCSAHGGTITGIPAGENRIIKIFGMGDKGIIYKGNKTGVSIVSGSNNDAGTIDAYAFVPTELTASAVSSSRIDLSWNAASSGASVDGYRVYRDGTLAGTVWTGTTTFSDTGLTPGIQYCYTVTAFDDFDNESGSTASMCATTAASADTQPPTTPEGLSASAVSSSRIDLTWSASTDDVGVVGYKIYRNGSEIAWPSTPSFSDTSLSPATQYCYTVAAYDAADNISDPSAQACATTGMPTTWYLDADEDGYGDSSNTQLADSQPSGYVSNSSDCNDDDPSIHPGAAETCDGVDNDCDGETDEGLLTTYYEDYDGDGYGNIGSTVEACSQPTGYVTNSDDCNDRSSLTYPGAIEICNDGLDNDCNGLVDDVYTDVPQPELALVSRAVGNGYSYELSISNASAYPAELFEQSSAYPSCVEDLGSRTILTIYDSDDLLLYGDYCYFSSPDALEEFSLWNYTGAPEPDSVYVTLYDRECDITWISNLTVVSPPTQVSPNNYDGSPDGETTLRWESMAGAVSYSVQVQGQEPDQSWTTLVDRTGIQADSLSITFPSTYYNCQWRVWTVDSLGNSGPVSGWMNFYYD